MGDPLRTYINDHLALIVGELELARRCLSENQNTPLAWLLGRIILEVERQQEVVKDALQRVGGQEDQLKQRAAWLAEKAGRLKLNNSLFQYSPLSRLLELEALAAAAFERQAFWEGLLAIHQSEPRLDGISLESFRQQSESHFNELNQHRRAAAETAFLPV